MLSTHRRRLHGLAAVALLLATVFGFFGQGQIKVSTNRNAEGWTQREAEIHGALTRRFESLIAAGSSAAQDAQSILTSGSTDDLQEDLSRIRRNRGVTALAVYDADGLPVAWVGIHRGRVPVSIRRGGLPYAFGGGPLFQYIYITETDPGGAGTAVAAILLQANLPSGLEGSGFASRFRAETGVPIRIQSPERAVNSGGFLWDLGWDGEPLLTVALENVAVDELRAPSIRFWVRFIGAMGFVVWGLVAAGGRGAAGHRVGTVVSLLVLALVLPVEHLWPGVSLTSPAHFLLPGINGVTLGRLLGVLLAMGLLCGLFPPKQRPWMGPVAAGLVVAGGFPLAVGLIGSGPSTSLLAGGVGGFLPYQLAVALALALLACLPLSLGTKREQREASGWYFIAAASLSMGLAFALGLVAKAEPGFSVGYLALWGIPAYLAARGLGSAIRSRKAMAWLFAALLGGCAALPAAWSAQIEARIAETEAQLNDLGGEPDPYLAYRLLRLASTADSLDAVISNPVELLYEIWASTGIHDDPIPMWLTLWSGGNLPEQDLAMGVFGNRPGEVDNSLEEVRESGVPSLRWWGLADARYVLLVPLVGDRVLSASVPSRGSPSLSSALGPIFAAMGQPGRGPLSLVPIPPDEVGEPGDDRIRWERRADGWRGIVPLRFPGGWYSAHQNVPLPTTLPMLARGTLLLLFDLILIFCIWGIGRGMARGRDIDVRTLTRVAGSFRARVTLALFGFFVLSIAIFGTLAYQTLSGAAESTATALAERLVDDGAAGYFESFGDMGILAEEVGADLLEYRDGELIEGSAEELVELGLYEGWVPEPIFRELEDRSEVRGVHRASLARWAYVMAYRAMPDGDILATPVPVEAGATALRRQEVAELLGFAIVLGAALSLALAFLVGGTLTRPIETLQIASERVGAGNLRVRLPSDRRDEFGAVFGAFNRMVLRIRRARKTLLRTTRRTQAIVEEAATGVLALDPDGRVTLANPRAEALLRDTIVVGQPIPASGKGAVELVEWVGRYFRDGMSEASTELHFGSRRIRVRGRRVQGEGPLGGAVLSLEDVTDELRTERILAWGEMAQQVAHEVKNPLTPIKLSVQHLQRAWEDNRPDFGDILGRNVSVILREIEHLAAIAKSFSRFGAPKAAGEDPLQAVSIRAVAEEVLHLYRGGEGVVEFELAIPSGLPKVKARETELREVLINLLENSRTAIPYEGRVVVGADAVTQGVELRVRDNGKGISPEFLTRIFEPHFSTRSTGTGLGLAIVRRLVESWGGSVTAESTMGEGTLFKILIPIWSSETEAP